MQPDSGYDLVLRLILKPIARFCVRRALKMQEIVQVFKAVMLEVAEEELGRHAARDSVSRLSMITGLQRADILRIRRRSPREAVENRSLLVRVIGQWASGRRYADAAGHPKPLTFEGRGSEFSALVASVSKELNPYAVLFELERSGLVERGDARLRLLNTMYLPSRDMAEAARMLGNDINDLILSVEGNMRTRDQPVPNLHLKVHYDNIAAERLPELRQWLLEEGTLFARRVQDRLSQCDKDVNPDLAAKAGGGRAVLGVFSLTEEPEAG